MIFRADFSPGTPRAEKAKIALAAICVQTTFVRLEMALATPCPVGIKRCVYARKRDREVDGLDDIIIGAQTQRFDDVGAFVLGGDHDHR